MTMQHRRVVPSILCFILVACLLTGCGAGNEKAGGESSPQGKSSTGKSSSGKAAEPFTPFKMLTSLEADTLRFKTLAFASDKQTFVIGGGTPKIWKLGSKKPLHVFDELYPQTGTVIECDALDLSSDGKTLALGAGDGSLTLIDMSTKKIKHELKKVHSNGIASVGFSSDGKTVLTSGFDGKAKLLSTETGKVISVLNVQSQERRVNSVLTSDGKIAVTVGMDALVWDTQSGKKLGDLSLGAARSAGVNGLAISPDGKLVATGEMTAEFEQAAIIWSVQSRKIVATLKHKLPIMRLSFSPDGKLLATAGLDPEAHIWRIADGKRVQTVQETELNSVDTLAWTAEGKALAVACEGTIRFWGLPGAIK